MNANTNLRQQIHESNKNFSFTEFFSYDGRDKHGATGLITPSQALTLPNVKNYTGLHITTIEQAIQAIYDLPETSENSSLNQKYTQLIEQSIRMHLINQRGIQLIIVMLPDQITRGQLDLLTAYQNTYGKIIENFAIDNNSQGNSPIVVYKEQNDEDNYSHSFENLIKHVETLPIIEIPKDFHEFIIGSVVSPNEMTLHCPDIPISLQAPAEQALNNGITFEDCNSAFTTKNFQTHQQPRVSRN